MIRRIVAALAALVLAAVGIVLVYAYANAADERALAGQQTVDVLVATADIPEGTPAGQLAEVVEVTPVPQTYVVDGAAKSLAELDDRISTAAVSAGEQLVTRRFATEEQLRAQGTFTLPKEAESLHQVTVPLAKPRALGGNIAAGDTVGVFISIQPEKEGDKPAPSMTHLTLHKVLVTRVEGGYVEPPAGQSDEGGDEEAAASGGVTGNNNEQAGASDTVLVTLALPAPDAERLVFGMEWGHVWLSFEPEDADENGTEIVVVTMPDDARDVYE